MRFVQRQVWRSAGTEAAAAVKKQACHGHSHREDDKAGPIGILQMSSLEFSTLKDRLPLPYLSRQDSADLPSYISLPYDYFATFMLLLVLSSPKPILSWNDSASRQHSRQVLLVYTQSRSPSPRSPTGLNLNL